MTDPTNPIDPPVTALPALGADSATASTGLNNLHQLIQLRWIAVLGQFLTIGVAHHALQLALPLREMLTVAGCLALFNVASLLRWRTGKEVRNLELFLVLLVDVAVLTIQLYLSGGTANPFVFLYLLQIVVGAMLLRVVYTWSIVFIAASCFATLSRVHLPLPMAPDLAQGFISPYRLGVLVCFVLNAILLVVFITRISRNLRERDAHLADVRQRAAEEEHIVRMGLLASGAAHELGTPLSTLAVILGDWRREPRLIQDPTLREDIAEMQAQVLRCKTIVSGILLSAGEARGEASAQTTLCAFVDSLANEWRETRQVGEFLYENHVDHDCPMVSDATLRQMVFNVLDNAREVSPAWVLLRATRDEDALLLVVSDHGPGFAPAMLSELGKPYRSSKGRPGGGLGLFLSVNVARKLGGVITARNLPGTGAEVSIRLPLSAIALPTPPSAAVP